MLHFNGGRPFHQVGRGVPSAQQGSHHGDRALVEQVFSRDGMPVQILSDQGNEVDSSLMREICRSYGFDKVRTTAYKPSTNGAVERFHRSLNSMLGKVVSDSQRDWVERLRYVMAAYRVSRHEATGFSPNLLVFGREVQAQIDLVFGSPDDSAPSNREDFVERQERL